MRHHSLELRFIIHAQSLVHELAKIDPLPAGDVGRACYVLCYRRRPSQALKTTTAQFWYRESGIRSVPQNATTQRARVTHTSGLAS
jgi:hypothetical protein